ncbi:MAG TPA: HAMP domain-containing sensor histidine kinase, partial [Coleofasciculaceae cyanobacterium]
TVFDLAREHVRGIAITIQDITREAELNEAKSQFISNVSHELRTPLFNIKSFIETLYEYGNDLSQEEQQEFLETANRETDRLTRLVNDVLDLSRLESCKLYHFYGVDLAQPIEQTLRTYQLNARDKGIELQQEIPPDLPPVLGNYDLLLQVFTNLVGNSLKFTDSGGKIVIRAYEIGAIPQGVELQPPPLAPDQSPDQSLKAGRVRIELSDTGIGIATEDQQAIFDRFYRVENRVHTLEGTGLGLSIVRNIIEKHRSQVHLVSEVGVGTTFWFDLPVFQDQRLNSQFERVKGTSEAEFSLSDQSTLSLPTNV